MKTAILTLAIASLAYSSSGQATATYTVTEISVSGARFVRANQINDFGLVVGTWEDFQGRRAFTWSQSGGLLDLNAELGATLSSASALNNSGVIVGQARIGGVDQGYRWSQGTGTQFLAKLTDRTPEPYSINELGQVGGSSMESTGTRAVRWSETGAAQDLGGQLGAFSRIISIENDGAMVGFRSVGAFGTTAFYRSPTGLVTNIAADEANDRNSFGLVVGGVSRGFSWTETGGLQQLALLAVS
jgi:hypothetical protein